MFTLALEKAESHSERSSAVGASSANTRVSPDPSTGSSVNGNPPPGPPVVRTTTQVRESCQATVVLGALRELAPDLLSALCDNTAT